MRKLILHMMTTVDGFIADPHRRLNRGWTNWDEEMKQFLNQVFAATDTLMYGRVIYQEMVPAWEAIADGNPPSGLTVTDGDVTFGKRVRDMHKIVLSTTLEHVDGNATLIRENLAEEITKIKAQPGTDILLYCGPGLVSTLTRLGLIDEYMLYVHPTVLGDGIPLFRNLPKALQLQLLETKIFGSGSILVRYKPTYSA